MKKKANNDTLAALTAAALALPGMLPQHANAESAPEELEINFQHSEYQEDRQPASFINGNQLAEAVDRYDISVNQLRISAPLGKNKNLDLNLTSETMSGASPWYIVPDVDGDAVQVMSGATIDEKRNDISLGLNVYKDTSKIGTGVAYSKENDYESIGFNLSNTRWYDNNNTTIDLGLGLSFDTLEPTQAPNIERIDNDEKKSLSGSGGITRVINKNLVIGTSINMAYYSGFLSDPYKLAFVNGSFLQDSRPDSKKQIALNVQLRQFIPLPIPAAMHVDYQGFSNTWGINSQTFKLAWFQNFGKHVQIAPQFRVYQQSAADFYQNYYSSERADGYYSSDYRLSEFSSTSMKIKTNFIFDFGKFHLSYEKYDSKNSGTNLKNSNPGLVDFTVVSVGFDLIPKR